MFDLLVNLIKTLENNKSSLEQKLSAIMSTFVRRKKGDGEVSLAAQVGRTLSNRQAKGHEEKERK